MNASRRQALAAFLAAIVLATGLPSLARGDELSTPPEEAPPEPVSLITNAPAVEYAPGQLVIGLVEDATRAEVETAVEEAGATVDQSIGAIDTQVLDVPRGEVAEAIESLEDSPAVEYVEREVVLEASDTVPNDTLWNEQWGPKLVGASKAWDATKGSAGVVIAVVDTGVDYGHPDLQDLFAPGFDFVNNDTNPRDDQGHGTAVAGVIAARTQNRQGQAGMCWNCKVMPVKVLGADGSGTTSVIAAGIVWAVNHGAKVINLSLGGAGTTQALADAVAFAASKEVLVLAAAGNSGSTTKFYPAGYPDVVSVAATTHADRLYEWSNRGRDWVEVSAPGCNTAPLRGGGYGDFCGTSSATPIVAGIAGLVLSLDANVGKEHFEQALTSTARPGPSTVRYGRVDALRTLAALRLTAPLNTAPPKIRGTTISGQTLDAWRGRWLGASSFAYRWQRCDAAGRVCVTIAGATSPTYLLKRSDIGSTLRLLMRAENAHGATRRRSKPTTIVERGTGAASAGALEAPPTTAPDSSASGSPPPPDGSGAGSVNPPQPTPPPPVDMVTAEVENAVSTLTDATGGTVASPPGP